MKVKIIKGKIFNASSQPGCSNEYIPYSFELNGKKNFICNLRYIEMNGKVIKNTSERRELAERLINLRKNKYVFIRFYGGVFKTPMELIEYVLESKRTFQRHGDFFREVDELTDFHGNLVECSCAFMFRIYDEKYLSEVKELFTKAKVEVNY